MGEEGGKKVRWDEICDSSSAPAQEREIKRQKVPSGEDEDSEGYEYEVFLSFRGPDTRNGFIDYLYNFLVDRGFKTFKDDVYLKKGESIDGNLVKAIQQSRIFIPVFSENYASSKPCLRELVAMVKWRKTEQAILPIFYDVTPSDVKNQEGSYKAAFDGYAMTNPDEIEEWRAALKQVAELCGLEKCEIANGKEGELVKFVAKNVEMMVPIRSKGMPKHFVEMEQNIEEIIKTLDAGNGDNKVRKVGIHGICGIGKTTISKALYNELLNNYERSSFLEDIGKNKKTDVNAGIVGLQKQLIKDMLYRCVEFTSRGDGARIIKSLLKGKRVLLVLDGVESTDDFDAFAQECFGPGSTIIVTTRNKRLLDGYKITPYKLPEMNVEQSRELLRKHAFNSDEPRKELGHLIEKIVDIIEGWPLSLTTIGAMLLGMREKAWIATHQKLKGIPHLGIEDQLVVCYEELKDNEKDIFLDIACFLTDVDRRIADRMWKSCGMYPDVELDKLNLISLVEIEDNMVKMHKLLREFGRETVRREHHHDLAKRSRLWSHVDAFNTLKNRNQKKCKALALCLTFPPSTSNVSHFEVGLFTKLQSLRFLQLDCAELKGNFKEHLRELRWLCWRVCHPQFAPTNFPPKKLIILDLSKSNITTDWAGWSQVKMAKLEVLNLTGCGDLTETPNFSGFSVLERLILQDCKSLVRIHSSITCLKKLEYLNIMNCEKLRSLPAGIKSMEGLEIYPPTAGTLVEES